MAYYPDNREISGYLSKISKYPLLEREEELELARKIRENQDQDSIDKLVNSNLRFVVSVAKRYQGRGLELMDLIQEGNLGLKKATLRFDETKGNRFISYAVWWVRQGILRALSEGTKTTRQPASMYQLYQKMGWYCDNYSKKYGTNPSDEHLTEVFLKKIGDKKGVLARFYQSREKEIRLDEEINGEDGDTRTRHELIESEQKSPYYEIEERNQSSVLDEELRTLLTPKEQRILYLYYIADETLSLQEIANEFGLTRERIRQIKDKALEKLRKSKKVRSLSDILR